jgi:AI-2 transport protein TqsA
MGEKSLPRMGSPVLVSVAAFVVVVAGLRAAQVIVVPFLLAAFLTLLSLPTLHWFQRKGLPTWLAMLAITIFVVLVGFVLVGVVGSSAVELQQQLPAYQERVIALQKSLDHWLTSHGIDSGFNFDQQFFDTERIVSLFGSMLGALGSILNNALIIVFLLIFMQLEAADLPGKLRAITSAGSDVSERLERIQSTVWHYVRLKTRLSLLTGVLVTAWLWLLGVHFPLLWGLVAFLLNFVPTIGSFIAAVPAILVAALQPDAAGQALSVADSLYLAGWTALGYVVINVVIGNVIEPRLMGTGLGLSTLVVFLSLVFWGWVLGPVGMVLSVPLTMIVKIVLDNSADLRWIAILLGPDVPVEPGSKLR